MPSSAEPAADFARWFAVKDASRVDLVAMSAHATGVNVLLGPQGFLHSIDLRPDSVP